METNLKDVPGKIEKIEQAINRSLGEFGIKDIEEKIIKINDSDARDFIPVLFELKEEFNLQCYQCDVNDPDDVRICFWNDLKNKKINLQFWKINTNIYYVYIVGLLQVKDGRITDGFDLQVDIVNGIDENTLKHIVRYLMEKIEVIK